MQTRAGAIDRPVDGIRINAACTAGAIEAPMLLSAIDARGHLAEERSRQLSLFDRFRSTEEVAKAVLWLGSDEASLRTGQAPAVDGGYRAL